MKTIFYFLAMYATALVPFALVFLVNGEIRGLFENWSYFWFVTACLFFAFYKDIRTGASFAICLLGAGLWIFFVEQTLVPLAVAVMVAPFIPKIVKIPKRKRV